jgi:hypothetical protein
MATPWTRLGSRIKSAAKREADRPEVDREHPAYRLRELQDFRVAVDREIDEEIVRARECGHTWSDLGGVLGMSKQGAQHRWRMAMERTGRAVYTGEHARSMTAFKVKQD